MLNTTLLKKNKIVLLIIITFSFLLPAIFFFKLPLYSSFERMLDRYLFKIRYHIKGAIKTDYNLCLFYYDDRDAEKLPQESCNREVLGKTIEILSESGARTIIPDLLFLEELTEERDRALVRSCREAGNVFLPLTFKGERGRVEEEIAGPKIVIEPKILKKGAPLDVDFYRLPFPELAESAEGLGSVGLNADSDGISRRLPLIFSYKKRNQYIPSIVLISICHFLKSDPQKMEIAFGEYIMLPDCISPNEGGKRDYYIPIDNKGRMIINYSGPWEKSRENYPLYRLLKADEEGNEQFKGSLVDTIVLIADLSNPQNDYSRGLFSASYPKSGIIGNALNTILTENYLIEQSLPFSIIATISLILLIWLAAWKLDRFSNLPQLVILDIFILYLLLQMILFIHLNILPFITLPLCGTLLSIISLTFYKLNRKVETPHPEADSPGTAALLQINEAACRKYDITPAQRKLLLIWQEGLTYKEVAVRLGLALSTIKNQVAQIKKRTGIYHKQEILETFFPSEESESE